MTYHWVTHLFVCSRHHSFFVTLIFFSATLCSLEGHAQFLRRSWIDEILDFQTEYGCFNITRPYEEITVPITSTEPQNIKRNATDWNNACNAHVTGVAGAMIAAAIRLIMENYF